MPHVYPRSREPWAETVAALSVVFLAPGLPGEWVPVVPQLWWCLCTSSLHRYHEWLALNWGLFTKPCEHSFHIWIIAVNLGRPCWIRTSDPDLRIVLYR